MGEKVAESRLEEKGRAVGEGKWEEAWRKKEEDEENKTDEKQDCYSINLHSIFIMK